MLIEDYETSVSADDSISGRDTSVNKPSDDFMQADCVSIYLKQIRQHDVMDAQTEYECAKLAKQGNKQARDRMIESNLRLVVKVVRRYQNRGLAFLDLIEEGNLGLIHGLDKYDPSKGYRFSTYATWWIKQYIERAIMNQSRTIRLPVHVIKRLNTCLRSGYRISEKVGHEFDIKQISEDIGIEENKVKDLLKLKNDVTSLDLPAFSDSDSSVVDYVPCEDEAMDPFRKANKEIMDSNLNLWLDHLSDIEAQIIVYRFGLKDQDAKTLEEVGQIVGLTRERVRQVQLRAIKKLREKLKQDFSDL